MATTTLTAVTVIGTGVAVNESTVVTAGTVTITVTDMSRSFLSLCNDGSANTVISIAAGADPMVAQGVGALSITLTSAQTQYVGGSWDSARLKSTSGTIVLTFSAAATVTVGLGYLSIY